MIMIMMIIIMMMMVIMMMIIRRKRIPVLAKYNISDITSNAGKKLNAINGRLLKPVRDTQQMYMKTKTTPMVI
jgi:hypothetical protein